MSEREMNALESLMAEARGAVKSLKRKGLTRTANLLKAALVEMNAATKEADSE